MGRLCILDIFVGCRCYYLLLMIVTALWVMSFLGSNEFWGATVSLIFFLQFLFLVLNRYMVMGRVFL